MYNQRFSPRIAEEWQHVEVLHHPGRQGKPAGRGRFLQGKDKVVIIQGGFSFTHICPFHCLEGFYLRQPLLSVLGEEKNIPKKRILRIFWIWFAPFAILTHSMQILAKHFSAQKCVIFVKIDFTKDLGVIFCARNLTNYLLMWLNT